MAKVNRFAVKELKREAWFQIVRIKGESVNGRLPYGMQKSLRRFSMLLNLLEALEQDGVLELCDDHESSDCVKESFWNKLARWLRFEPPDEVDDS